MKYFMKIAQSFASVISHVVPRHFFLVHQNPHELRHCQTWVRVVELYGDLPTATII